MTKQTWLAMWGTAFAIFGGVIAASPVPAWHTYLSTTLLLVGGIVLGRALK